MNGVNVRVVGMLLKQLFRLVDRGRLRGFVTDFSDQIRVKVLGTASEVDDRTVLPVLDLIDGIIEQDNIDVEMLKEVIQHLFTVLPYVLFQEFARFIFDWVEKKILGSASKIDDMLLLPAIQTARLVLDV